MRRRDFIRLVAGAAIAAPYGAAAETNTKIYHLGTLTIGPPIPPTEGTGAILIAGLAKRGYALGQNLTYEARGAAGNMSQMANLMQQLRAANVDAVVTVGYPAAVAAKASGVATVIATGSGDPVCDRTRRQPGTAGWQCHRNIRRRCGAFDQAPWAPESPVAATAQCRHALE